MSNNHHHRVGVYPFWYEPVSSLTNNPPQFRGFGEQKMELRSTTKHKSGTIPSVIFSNTNGYKLEELVKGKPDGKKAVPGARISVRYIGKLQKNGKIFVDYSKTPFEFILGSGEVLQAFEFGVGGFLPGVESGVEGMLVGGKRRITVPPLMGYGKGGDGKLVPPNAWLVFEVELLDVSAGSSMIEAISDVTTHDNGLTIEVLVKGKPDGKIAVPGKWIRALYTGKLQKNGEIFDSKFSKRPKTFCLGGDHKLGLGFSFGITGMHVGEIRKITVPPVYGFVGKRVPRHAWLVFQVELVEVVDDGIYYDYDG
ncbi:FKBP-type peptidyl-prolyl cis-trans isomerase domain [Arabidopsis suecica]|uniref:peptidylprolyl isomerase n=1 Tax=Arabidopsis suecica TaxID=45249 RepID=A0A8T1YS97_ARASU|nr:FKBP-type peptidyl-prolyl cis-trans isomerase domain [Arabidopsis suecica]